jgi:hypothetical protein
MVVAGMFDLESTTSVIVCRVRSKLLDENLAASIIVVLLIFLAGSVFSLDHAELHDMVLSYVPRRELVNGYPKLGLVLDRTAEAISSSFITHRTCPVLLARLHGRPRSPAWVASEPLSVLFVGQTSSTSIVPSRFRREEDPLSYGTDRSPERRRRRPVIGGFRQ